MQVEKFRTTIQSQPQIFTKDNKYTRIARGILFVGATGVSFSIAYPETITKGNPAVVVFTNIGVIGSYGLLGTWGLYMFGDKVIDEIQQLRKYPSICSALLKSAQAVSSIIMGNLSQIPTSAIALEFHGMAWVVPTQLGGCWVPTMSQYILTEAMIKKIQRSPKFAFSLERKMRLVLVHQLHKVFENTLKHSRLMTLDEKEANFKKWAIARNTGKQQEIIANLFDDLVGINERFYRPSTIGNKYIRGVRTGVQVISSSLAFLYLLQIYLLSEEIAEKKIDSKEGVDILSGASVFSLLYLVIGGTYIGSGNFFDLGCDLFGIKRDESLEEHAFPKFSRGLYCLALLIAATPQWQTVVIANNQYSADTGFGLTYIIGNTLTSTMFVYTAMKELLDLGMRKAIDHPRMSKHLKVMKQLDSDIQEAMEELFKPPPWRPLRARPTDSGLRPQEKSLEKSRYFKDSRDHFSPIRGLKNLLYRTKIFFPGAGEAKSRCFERRRP